jgi:competence protein ComEC
LADGVSCDEAGCVAGLADGSLVAQSQRADALADDCVRAVLVVTARQPPGDCAASVIDQDRLRRQGALAIRQTAKGFAVEAVKPRGFDRPWSPAVAGEGDLDLPLLARPAVPRGRDATPSEADLQAEE